jgi:hypothetical protein
MLLRCGAEWSVQIERTTPTHLCGGGGVHFGVLYTNASFSYMIFISKKKYGRRVPYLSSARISPVELMLLSGTHPIT